jgi:hypothetical protein
MTRPAVLAPLLVVTAIGLALAPVVAMGALFGIGETERRFLDWRVLGDGLGATLQVVLIYLMARLLITGRMPFMAQRLDKTTEIKSYGGGAKQAQRLDKEFPFRLIGLRYDDEESHDFVATRKPDTLMAMRFMGMSDDQMGELSKLATLLIGKTLDNTDGVPVQWSATMVPKPKNAGREYEPKFRGPDGKLHPMHQADKFEAFEAGSSRRRWEALLADNQFTVTLEDIVEICKDLVELGVGSPTDG